MITVGLFEMQLLKDKIAEEWKLPNEKLIPLLMEFSTIQEKEFVEAFVVSWKHNHPNGKVPQGKRADRIIEEGDTFEVRSEKEFAGIAKSNKSVREPGAGSIIDQILTLHKAGKSRAEIVAAGFNKSTVARQVGEYEKKNKK
jgi:hypothetical protein